MTKTPDPFSTRKKLLFTLILLVGVPVAGFVALEGGSSLVVLSSDLWRLTRLKEEKRFTQYDTLLGWVSIPNLRILDMYGPGAHLEINGQGWRGTSEIAPETPPGRIRVICSGDSFAFGVGVGNADTWCKRLEARDPRIEAVNLGQSGYGVDQMFLRFKREGAALGHDIHVFTFIWDNLYRMQLNTLWGYPKPTLALHGGALAVENVPVPRRAFLMPRLNRVLSGVRGALRNLRTVELTRRFRAGLAGDGAVWTDRGFVSGAADSATWEIAAEVLEELAAMHRAAGNAFFVVHLPSGDDAGYLSARVWRPLAQQTAAAQGLAYLDLTDSLARLPADSLSRIFLPNDPHYTALGQDWVAGKLYDFFRRTPEVARRLDGAVGARRDTIEARPAAGSTR